MTVIPFGMRSACTDDFSIQNKIVCYQQALRKWAGHLTGNELAVVEVLIDRTVGWGRREAYFTIRALIAGDGVYSGIGISRRTAFRVLNSLEVKGVIQRRKDPNVPDRVHFIVNVDWSPDLALAVPKRLEGRCHSDTTQCHDDTTRCQDGTLYTGSHLQVSLTGNHPGAAAPVRLNSAEIVREAATTAAATHRSRLATKTTAQSTVDSADAIWRAALIDTFPGTAYRTWGVREKAQIKLAAKNWRGDISFDEFIDWAIRNWTAIMAKQFKWMTREKPPTVPTLSFLIAFITQFADCRAEHKLEAWQSSADRTDIEKRMARGQTYEQANAAQAKDKAAGALREEMTKREIHVRAREMSAEQKLAQAQRVAEFEGRVLIHPNSPAARRMRGLAGQRVALAPATVLEAEIDMSRNPFDQSA